MLFRSNFLVRPLKEESVGTNGERAANAPADRLRLSESLHQAALPISNGSFTFSTYNSALRPWAVALCGVVSLERHSRPLSRPAAPRLKRISRRAAQRNFP